MSTIHFGNSQTPMNKQVMALDATTTATIWTPASAKKIVLTDLHITADNVVSGTIRLLFYASADPTAATPTMVFEGMLHSAAIVAHFDTPKVNPDNDGIMRVVSSMAGNIWINCGGFEV